MFKVKFKLSEFSLVIVSVNISKILSLYEFKNNQFNQEMLWLKTQ